MGLFKKKKEEKQQVEEVKKMIVGVSPELVTRVKDKVKNIHDEKEELKRDYEDSVKRLSVVEAKCDAIESTFKNFKKEFMSEFMDKAQEKLDEITKSINDSVLGNESRINKFDDELMKLSKGQEELEFMTAFQDNYQLIKLCIYMITNLDPSTQIIIVSLLQTIHTICEEMVTRRLWDTGKDAIITSLYNLKSYWRTKDERVENLINNEIEALKILR